MKGGKRHGLFSSKGHRAPPFARKGGGYTSIARSDRMHEPDAAPLVRSGDGAMAGVSP